MVNTTRYFTNSKRSDSQKRRQRRDRRQRRERLTNHSFDAFNACLYRACRDAQDRPFTLLALRLCVRFSVDLVPRPLEGTLHGDLLGLLNSCNSSNSIFPLIARETCLQTSGFRFWTVPQ